MPLEVYSGKHYNHSSLANFLALCHLNSSQLPQLPASAQDTKEPAQVCHCEASYLPDDDLKQEVVG